MIRRLHILLFRRFIKVNTWCIDLNIKDEVLETNNLAQSWTETGQDRSRLWELWRAIAAVQAQVPSLVIRVQARQAGREMEVRQAQQYCSLLSFNLFIC